MPLQSEFPLDSKKKENQMLKDRGFHIARLRIRAQVYIRKCIVQSVTTMGNKALGWAIF